jgi:hypothetical protein
MGWCELFGKCPAVVPCATADGESGSSLKLGSCGSTSCAPWYWKTCFENVFKMNPCIQLSFPQMNYNLVLGLSCTLNSVIPPSVGVIGFAEYVCTHPFLTFTVEDPDYVPEDNE